MADFLRRKPSFLHCLSVSKLAHASSFFLPLKLLCWRVDEVWGASQLLTDGDGYEESGSQSDANPFLGLGLM